MSVWLIQIGTVKRLKPSAFTGSSPVTDTMKTDNKGKKCKKCKKGIYKETEQLDDLRGTLHCDKCNHQILRYS